MLPCVCTFNPSAARIIVGGEAIQGNGSVGKHVQPVKSIVIEGVDAVQGDRRTRCGCGRCVVERSAEPIVPVGRDVVERDGAIAKDLQPKLVVRRIVAIIVANEVVHARQGHALRGAETMVIQARAAFRVPIRVDIVHADGAFAEGFEADVAITLEDICAGQCDATDRAGPLVIQISSIHAVRIRCQIAGRDGMVAQHIQAVAGVVIEVIVHGAGVVHRDGGCRRCSRGIHYPGWLQNRCSHLRPGCWW